jgi:hypothetical protein
VSDDFTPSLSSTAFVTITVPNRAPVANAGPDRTVDTSTSVQLDGSLSHDPDSGDTISYAWTQIGTPGVILSRANTANPTFTAPASTTSLTFELTVNDDFTPSLSSTAFVTITVGDRSPVANAGKDKTVNAGDTVMLDGSESVDPDHGDTLTYAWTQTGGGPSVSLSSDTVSNPTFTAPASAASLTFKLTVSDGKLSNSDSVTIIVNRPPVANAGPDQNVNAGATATLDGSSSSDPDHDTLGYKWTQTGGPAVSLSSDTAANPTFTAPASSASLTFKLTASDGKLSSADSVLVTVVKKASPAVKVYKRPQTKLVKAKILSAKRMATFRFSGSLGKGKLSFQCKLDGGKYKSCSSGKSYKHLKPGKHVLRVRAKDATGKVDLSPATKRFKI